MAAESKKITDLELRVPQDDFNFLVATVNDNYRVTFSGISDQVLSEIDSSDYLGPLSGHLQSQIDAISGPDGVLDVSGYLDDKIDDISGFLQNQINNFDGGNQAINDLSGHLQYQISLNAIGITSLDNELNQISDSETLINNLSGVLQSGIDSNQSLINTLSGSIDSGGGIDSVVINNLSGLLQSGITENSGTINSVSGNLQNQLNSIPGTTITSSSAGSFVFFSEVSDYNGPVISTYYDTPSPEKYLSGVSVQSAVDLKAHIRWDGPGNDYIGTGYINGIQIPKENIIELGTNTRRFEGFIDHLNADGLTKLTGVANGATGFIDLVSLGSGPMADNITIDSISNATALAGQELGSTELKAGDQIDIFVYYPSSLFENSLTTPSTIEVDNYGISNGIASKQYNFTDDGSYKKATIPVTVSNRNGDLGVRLRSVNAMGATGDYQTSDIDFIGADDSRLLSQTYPSISASAPASYNGRSDGLREDESTTFTNSVSNFDSTSDTILYTPSIVNNASFSITNPNSLEQTKTVSYLDGIYSNQNNLNIRVVRTSNGATDSEDLSIKIANGPVIHSSLIITPAVSSSSNYIVGQSELKDGDTVNVKAIVDTQGESNSSIRLKVFNNGISNGSQTNYGSYSSVSIGSSTRSYSYNLTSGNGSNYTVEGDAYGSDPTIYVVAGDTLTFNNNTGGHPLAVKNSSDTILASESGSTLSFTPATAGTYTYYCTVSGHENMNGQIIVIDRTNDLYEYTIPVIVTSSRNGDLDVELQARNQYLTVSDSKSSSNLAAVNNSGPVVSITSVSYPTDQQAIKLGESATVTHTASNYDTISYSDPSNQNQLTISNASTFEASKTVSYNSGGYNISTNNFKVFATKNSNGLTASSSTIVKIANTPLSLSISNLASSLPSSSSGLSDNFNLNSSQVMLSAPSLSTSSLQDPASLLSHTSSGTGINSNIFSITVKDTDEKGEFTWVVSARNLANIETNSITTNPNYLIEGFDQREVSASPNDLAAGLAYIGTTVSNPNNIYFENVSEGGSAANGGTVYTFLQLDQGTQLDFSFNHDNRFCVCDSNGLVDNNGDYVFNLDSLSRAANADVNNPAKYIIRED